MARRLARANASKMEAEERFVFAQADLKRYEELFKEGLTSKKQLDEAREKVAVGEKELAERQAELELVKSDRLAGVREDMAVSEKEYAVAQARLDRLLAGTRPEEIAAARAELERLQAEQRHLESHIRLCEVVSPVAARVATHRPKEIIGAYLKKGDLIVKVDETQRVSVEIPVPEKKIADVATAQPVVFKARAYPDQTFHGTVTAIAPVVTEDPADPGQHVLVMTELNNISNLLKPDMTGMAKIACGKRRVVDLIARKFHQFFRVEFWSWW